MAKRYYQSKKDRRDERRGEDRHLRLLGDEFYAGLDPRRRLEREDAGMINEDHRAFANLPQEVIMREYPKAGFYATDKLDDTIRGVDGQMDADSRQALRNRSREKY